MSEEEKKQKDTGQMSRRQFLKDAGLIVGGATLGSVALVNACNGGTTTVTSPGQTVTQTKTNTTTTTVGGGATVTVPGPGATVTTTRTITSTPPGPAALPNAFALHINGADVVVNAEPFWPLSYVLRHVMGLTGTKTGCDRGECGTCTVLLGGKTGKAVYSCCIPVAEAEGMDIVTIEGMANGATLSKVQQAFLNTQTFQCGYCTPGQIMAAAGLLNEIPKPTLKQAQEGMSGNLCFCGDYTRILKAVLQAAA